MKIKLKELSKKQIEAVKACIELGWSKDKICPLFNISEELLNQIPFVNLERTTK